MIEGLKNKNQLLVQKNQSFWESLQRQLEVWDLSDKEKNTLLLLRGMSIIKSPLFEKKFENDREPNIFYLSKIVNYW